MGLVACALPDVFPPPLTQASEAQGQMPHLVLVPHVVLAVVRFASPHSPGFCSPCIEGCFSLLEACP